MSQAERLGRQWVTKFKEHVDRQMFGMPYSLPCPYSCFPHSIEIAPLWTLFLLTKLQRSLSRLQ